jgi:alanine racemase
MRTWIEISEYKLIKNIENIKLFLSNNIGLVLKGNAYGFGLKEIINLINKNNLCETIFLCHSEEAAAARSFGYKKNIILMAANYDKLLENAIENHNVVVSCYSLMFLEKICNFSNKINKKIDIYVKIDTGANRFGIKKEEIDSLIEIIGRHKFINLIGLLTHFTDIDSFETIITNSQSLKFVNICNYIENKINKKIFKIANSSNVIDLENNFDISKIGTLAYGLFLKNEIKKRFLKKNIQFNFELIFSWKTVIISIKSLNKGDFYGYNNNIAKNDLLLAAIPVGYSDGYIYQQLCEKCFVVINNKYAEIVEVNMNLIIIDITKIKKHVKINDQVTLIDNNFKKISINYIYKNTKITPWGIVSLISKDIERIIVSYR